jgi:hypothetical protein
MKRRFIMKKVIYSGMILMFATLATNANPISNFKPYEQEGTESTEAPSAPEGHEHQVPEEHNSPVKHEGAHE